MDQHQEQQLLLLLLLLLPLLLRRRHAQRQAPLCTMRLQQPSSSGL
jgi:hypothetical protein